jgi:hypothetical protein
MVADALEADSVLDRGMAEDLAADRVVAGINHLCVLDALLVLRHINHACSKQGWPQGDGRRQQRKVTDLLRNRTGGAWPALR